MDEIEVKKEFEKKKVLTIEQLVDLLESSVITVRRYLKKWNTHTSINHNSRYYTLPVIPRFDDHGLWKYQTILFSKYGTLKQTIIELIRQSEAGLSAGEIARVVAIPSNSSIFSQLHTISALRREKHQGHFVYLSAEHARYEKQKFRLSNSGGMARFPTDEEAVRILVHYIKHPQVSIEELSAKVSEEGGTVIVPTVIRSFLEHHDLLKKIQDTNR